MLNSLMMRLFPRKASGRDSLFLIGFLKIKLETNELGKTISKLLELILPVVATLRHTAVSQSHHQDEAL